MDIFKTIYTSKINSFLSSVLKELFYKIIITF